MRIPVCIHYNPQTYMTKIHVTFFCLLAVGLAALPAHAQTPAFGLTGGNLSQSVQNNTSGYAFNVNSTVDVTALGFFDAGQNGLTNSHMVGIFNSMGVLIASAMVPSGVGAMLVDQFRYVGITPTTLLPGQYTIGAFYAAGDQDTGLVNATGFTTHPSITFVGARGIVGPVFTNPTNSNPSFNPGVFGPNFLVAQAVPEAGTTAALLSLALFPLIAAQRRLRSGATAKR